MFRVSPVTSRLCDLYTPGVSTIPYANTKSWLYIHNARVTFEKYIRTIIKHYFNHEKKTKRQRRGRNMFYEVGTVSP